MYNMAKTKKLTENQVALNLIQDLLRDGLISYSTSLKMKERWL